MARTPLFARLVAQLRLARAAHRAGLTPEELLARRAAAAPKGGLSRRQLLRSAAIGAGALAVAPLLPGCTVGGPDPEPTVVIVGAGMAGLHCAYRLAQVGVQAKLYDAGNRPGGRMFTDHETFGPTQHCELGGELIDTGHTTMLALAAELEIELLDYDNDDAALRTLVAEIAGVELTDEEILTGFMPIAAAIDDALATLTDQEYGFVSYDNPNGGEALDALSLTAWLDEQGFSGPVRTLLEVAYTIEYGLDADETNVLNMMFLISTDTEAFEVFGDSDERFHAKNGNDAFIAGLVRRIGEQNIELGSALEGLRDAGGVYTLTFRKGNGTYEVTADRVVLALPFTKLREVTLDVELRPEKRKAIDELGYGTNAKLMLGFDGKPWRDAGSNGELFTDRPIQATWETSRLQAGEQGILTVFTGGAPGVAAGDGTPEAQADLALDDLDAVFPGSRAAYNGKVARFHWPSFPLTKGSYSAYLVGQYTTITGVESLPEGRVHFCGEHTSVDAQGYMEGAALSGAIVADEIATAFGIDGEAAARQALDAQPAAAHVWQKARATRLAPGRRLRRARALSR